MPLIPCVFRSSPSSLTFSSISSFRIRFESFPRDSSSSYPPNMIFPPRLVPPPVRRFFLEYPRIGSRRSLKSFSSRSGTLAFSHSGSSNRYSPGSRLLFFRLSSFRALPVIRFRLPEEKQKTKINPQIEIDFFLFLYKKNKNNNKNQTVEGADPLQMCSMYFIFSFNTICFHLYRFVLSMYDCETFSTM